MITQWTLCTTGRLYKACISSGNLHWMYRYWSIINMLAPDLIWPEWGGGRLWNCQIKHCRVLAPDLIWPEWGLWNCQNKHCGLLAPYLNWPEWGFETVGTNYLIGWNWECVVYSAKNYKIDRHFKVKNSLCQIEKYPARVESSSSL